MFPFSHFWASNSNLIGVHVSNCEDPGQLEYRTAQGSDLEPLGKKESGSVSCKLLLAYKVNLYAQQTFHATAAQSSTSFVYQELLYVLVIGSYLLHVWLTRNASFVLTVFF